ncbi:MAG: hypothetical protein ACXV8I_01925 [Methylobacter sp.]
MRIALKLPFTSLAQASYLPGQDLTGYPERPDVIALTPSRKIDIPLDTTLVLKLGQSPPPT